jgi:hypothetical protein
MKLLVNSLLNQCLGSQIKLLLIPLVKLHLLLDLILFLIQLQPLLPFKQLQTLLNKLIQINHKCQRCRLNSINSISQTTLIILLNFSLLNQVNQILQPHYHFNNQVKDLKWYLRMMVRVLWTLSANKKTGRVMFAQPRILSTCKNALFVKPLKDLIKYLIRISRLSLNHNLQIKLSKISRAQMSTLLKNKKSQL